MKLNGVEFINYMRFANARVMFDNKLNIFEGINYEEDGGSNGAGKCLSGSSRVLLSNGNYVKIEDLVANKKEYNKELIISLNSTLQQSSAKIKNFINSGKKVCYKIILHSGEEIIATKNHRFPTNYGWIDLEKINKIISEGKSVYICAPREICYFGNKEIETFIPKLLALLIGDGHVGKKVSFSNNNNFLLKEFKNIILNNFEGLHINTYTKKGNKAVDIAVTSNTIRSPLYRNKINQVHDIFKNKLLNLKKNNRWEDLAEIAKVNPYTLTTICSNFSLSRRVTRYENLHNINIGLNLNIPQESYSFIGRKENQLIKLLKSYSLYGLKSSNKIVPQEVFSWKKEHIITFLSYLFSTDGCVQLNRSTGSISYSSISKQLILDIKHLLLRFGILSIIRNRKLPKRLKGKNKYKTINRNNSFYSYELIIYDRESLTKFCNEIGIVHPDKNKKIQKLKVILNKNNRANPNLDIIPRNVLTDNLLFYPSINITRNFLLKYYDIHYKRIANANILWDEFVTSTYYGLVNTYDLEVEAAWEPNFICNNLYVHNSSITQGISWILFGDTSRGIRADDVIRWGTEQCTGTLFLDNGAKIVRGRGKDNYVKLFIDGKEVIGRTASVLNEKVAEYIGVNKEVFFNSIFWGQDWGTVLIEGTDKERKDLLGTLIEFSKIDEALKQVREELKKLTTNKTKLETEYNIYKSKVDDIDKELLESERITLQDKKVQIESEISTLDDLILKVKEFTRLKTQYDEYILLKPQVEGWNIKLEEIKQHRQVLENDNKELDAKINTLTDEINKISGVNSASKTSVSKLEKALSLNNCPTCLQSIDEGHKKHLQEEIQREQEKIDFNLKKINELTLESNVFKDKKKENQSILNGFIPEESNIMSKISKFNSLDSIFKDKAFDSIDLGSQNESDLLNKSKDLKNELNKIQNRLPEIVVKVKEYNEAYSKVADTENSLKETIKWYDTYSELEKIFGQKGFRTYLLDNLIRDLEYKTNQYLKELTDRNIIIEIKSEEDLKILVTEDERTCDWNSFSGGEKKRIAVALRLGLWTYLLEQNCRLNFGLFDEVLGGLDLVGRERVIELLELLAQRYDTQVFLISHFPVKELATDWNKILIERRNGVSTITEG